MPRTPTAVDPRSVVAQSRLDEDPRLKTIWAGYAFSKDFREERGHAYMLDDQVYTERSRSSQAAGHLHPLPCVGLRAVQEGRRRRPVQGLRDAEPDALRRGARAREVPGRLHRLPRPVVDGAARDAAGVHRRDQGGQGRRRASPTTTSTPWRRGRRCGRSCAASATSSTTSRARRSGSPIRGSKGLKADRDPGLLRGDRLQGLDARRHRRAGAEGAAPRVRDVEPGHPRPLGRDLRRLPHAVPARGRAQGQRPSRPQPAAQHQPRLPDLPQVVGGGAEGARGDASRCASSSCATGRWTRPSR